MSGITFFSVINDSRTVEDTRLFTCRSIFTLSRGETQVLDTAPAIPPATTCFICLLGMNDFDGVSTLARGSFTGSTEVDDFCAVSFKTMLSRVKWHVSNSSQTKRKYRYVATPQTSQSCQKVQIKKDIDHQTLISGLCVTIGGWAWLLMLPGCSALPWSLKAESRRHVYMHVERENTVDILIEIRSCSNARYLTGRLKITFSLPM